MLFLAVAVLSIGLIDSLEALAAALRHVQGAQNSLISFAMMMVIVPQLILYSVWSAPSAPLSAVDASQVPSYFMSALVCALVARLALLSGAS